MSPVRIGLVGYGKGGRHFHAPMIEHAEGFVALQHTGGVSSHVIGSLAAQGEPGPRFRVIGSTATFVLEDDDGQTERALAGRTPVSEGEDWGTVPESRWGRIHRNGVATPVPAQRGSWSDFYTGFTRAVRGSAPPPGRPLGSRGHAGGAGRRPAECGHRAGPAGGRAPHRIGLKAPRKRPSACTGSPEAQPSSATTPVYPSRTRAAATAG
jgi:predicted dehydrogenase